MYIPNIYTGFSPATLPVQEIYWAASWCNKGTTKGDRIYVFFNNNDGGYDASFGFSNSKTLYVSANTTKTFWNGQILHLDNYQPYNICFRHILGIRKI